MRRRRRNNLLQAREVNKVVAGLLEIAENVKQTAVREVDPAGWPVSVPTSASGSPKQSSVARFRCSLILKRKGVNHE